MPNKFRCRLKFKIEQQLEASISNITCSTIIAINSQSILSKYAEIVDEFLCTQTFMEQNHIPEIYFHMQIFSTYKSDFMHNP